MSPKAKKPVDWAEVERLCLRSFCGGILSPDEQSRLEDAYKRYPKEYAERTHAVREGERSRIRSM